MMKHILNIRLESMNELIKNFNQDLIKVQELKNSGVDKMSTIERTIIDSKNFMEAYCNKLESFVSKEDVTYPEYEKLFKEDDKKIYELIEKYNTAMEYLRSEK